jgi:hypothetical protein
VIATPDQASSCGGVGSSGTIGVERAGYTNATIAGRLSLSPKTVRNHVSNIFGKLQVADRAQAITRAREAGPQPWRSSPPPRSDHPRPRGRPDCEHAAGPSDGRSSARARLAWGASAGCGAPISPRRPWPPPETTNVPPLVAFSAAQSREI